MATCGLQDLNRGNASDFIGECVVKRSCEPCLKTDDDKSATVFCNDCNEFLCETCLNPHIVFKQGKHDMVSVKDKESTTVIILDMKGMDKCVEHGKRIKFFCEDHLKLCCTSCVFAHRKCEKFDVIASICNQKGTDLHELKQSLSKLKSDADAFVAECKQSENQMIVSIAEVSKDFDEMRDRMITLFDEAKHELLTKANALKVEEAKRLDQMQSLCTNVIEDINNLFPMSSAIEEHGTLEQMFIFSKHNEEKYKKIEFNINEQRKKHVASKVTLSYPEEVYSLLEMGNDFIEMNLEPADDSRSEATFNFEVENVSKLKESVLSRKFMVLNLPWKIMAKKHEQKSLGFFIQCNAESDSTSWSCSAAAELRIINQKQGGDDFTRKIQHLFCSKQNDWGYNAFLPWNDLLDPDKGYCKNDSVILQVHIRAVEPH